LEFQLYPKSHKHDQTSTRNPLHPPLFSQIFLLPIPCSTPVPDAEHPIIHFYVINSFNYSQNSSFFFSVLKSFGEISLLSEARPVMSYNPSSIPPEIND
jgi:hypothetical protein